MPSATRDAALRGIQTDLAGGHPRAGMPAMAAPPTRSPRRRQLDLKSARTALLGLTVFQLVILSLPAQLAVSHLRTEHLENPEGLDVRAPRLSWHVASTNRAQWQTAWRVLAAEDPAALAKDRGDLWDSGKVPGDETLNASYGGKPLKSGQVVWWKVQVWDPAGRRSAWSEPARWTMGLLQAGDWKADWISHHDPTPLRTDRKTLYLPPARHYRKDFVNGQAVRRATLYASALGLVEFHLNGRRVGDAWFEPGWSDYHQRAYVRTHDVTGLLQAGKNRVGAIVAEGWYSGYVGYGLLVGYGPHRSGRYFYGKTPALLAQLEIEYVDGSRQTVVTDPTWEVSSDGPIREADLIMGESYDARKEDPGWANPGTLSFWNWERAIRATENGPALARFFEPSGSREVDLGFRAPGRLQAYAAPPIRVTEGLAAVGLTEPQPGVYIFDLGQNMAGAVQLKIEAPAGTRLKLRYGEMLHPDGRLMTENLRRARATDEYICRGSGGVEIWTPRFTYHGFQYVELTGLPGRPSRDMITGLVLHNDTTITGDFACSDDVMTQFWRNTLWTQRANFIEIPTDCPQRDERLGWMGDAQVYARTATFNADVAAFLSKWIDDVREAQREFGAYPDYAPYPMAHGAPGQTWGTAWTDAGVIVPWTLWMVYGDTRVLENHWASMTRFMDWRQRRAPDFLGRRDGNTWGDWLNVNEETPIEYVDQCYFAYSAARMMEMADALGKTGEAGRYRDLGRKIQGAWARRYVAPDGTLAVGTQTAHVLALWAGLAGRSAPTLAKALADRIAKNGHHMATGFLGTKSLLGVLTDHGFNDLAVRLYQSRQFPSWGYEVVNGATTVWERWDSFTKEHGFEGDSGKNNAAMNSFSHYSFGAVNEWAFRRLGGIDTDGPGYQRILIRPNPPRPGTNPEQSPIDWVRTRYESPRGRIVSAWRRTADRFQQEVEIPANTTAAVELPADSPDAVTEGGQPVDRVDGVRRVRAGQGRVSLEIGSGLYRFESLWTPGKR